MTILDVAALMRAHAGGRNPNQLAADSAGLLASQTWYRYWNREGDFKRLPTSDAIRGITVALRLPDDTATVLSFAKDCGLRVSDPRALVAQWLPGNVGALDELPELAAAVSRLIGTVSAAVVGPSGEPWRAEVVRDANTVMGLLAKAIAERADRPNG